MEKAMATIRECMNKLAAIRVQVIDIPTTGAQIAEVYNVLSALRKEMAEEAVTEHEAEG